MAVEIDSEKILRAAGWLEDSCVPGLADVTNRLEDAYKIVFPGFGMALVGAEAYYDSICLYHVENLRAGVEVVTSVADGLRKTAENWETAEEINVETFEGKPTDSDKVTYIDGFSDDLWSLSPLNATWEDVNGVVDFVAMETCLIGALVCSVICPPFSYALMAASGLVANLASIVDAKKEIANVANDLGSVAESFYYDTLSEAGAISGWNDSSSKMFVEKCQAIYYELT